jgi:hypothetical protein
MQAYACKSKRGSSNYTHLAECQNIVIDLMVKCSANPNRSLRLHTSLSPPLTKSNIAGFVKVADAMLDQGVV